LKSCDVATRLSVCRTVCRPTEVETGRPVGSAHQFPTSATPPPCSHTLLPLCYRLTSSTSSGHLSSRCSDLLLPSPHNFTNNLDASSGCSVGRVRSPPSLLHGVLKFQALPIFAHYFPHDTLHEQPWRAAWLPRWGCSFLPLPPGGTCDSSDLCCRPSLVYLTSFSVSVHCISF
jgi:hypothetical protein